MAITPTPPTPRSEPERDALVLELSGLMLPLAHELRHLAARVFAPLGLRPSGALVLELIERGVDRPKALAEVLETVQSAVSAILADLDGLGCITREVDPADRRKVRLELTDEGRALYARLGEAWLEMGRRHLEAVDLDDLRVVARVAGALARRDTP